MKNITLKSFEVVPPTNSRAALVQYECGCEDIESHHAVRYHCAQSTTKYWRTGTLLEKNIYTEARNRFVALVRAEYSLPSTSPLGFVSQEICEPILRKIERKDSITGACIKEGISKLCKSKSIASRFRDAIEKLTKGNSYWNTADSGLSPKSIQVIQKKLKSNTWQRLILRYLGGKDFRKFFDSPRNFSKSACRYRIKLMALVLHKLQSQNLIDKMSESEIHQLFSRALTIFDEHEDEFVESWNPFAQLENEDAISEEAILAFYLPNAGFNSGFLTVGDAYCEKYIDLNKNLPHIVAITLKQLFVEAGYGSIDTSHNQRLISTTSSGLDDVNSSDSSDIEMEYLVLS